MRVASVIRFRRPQREQSCDVYDGFTLITVLSGTYRFSIAYAGKQLACGKARVNSMRMTQTGADHRG